MTVTRTIGTGQTNTTIASWVTDIPSDLTGVGADAWRGELLNEGFTDSTNPVFDIANRTTSPSRNIVLTCATGASFKDHASKDTNKLQYNTSYGAYIDFTGTGANSRAFRINNVADITCSGLMIRHSGNVGAFSSAQALRTLSTSKTATIIENCIIEQHYGDFNLGVIDMASATMRNALIIDRTGNAANCFGISSGVAHYITIVRPSDVAANSAYALSGNGYNTISNIAAFGFSSLATHGGPGWTDYANIATSMSSNLDGMTVTTLSHNTSTFNQPSTSGGNHDFRIPTGSGLKDAGSTISGISTDILGNTRSGTPDIGCFEFGATGGGGSTIVGAMPSGLSPLGGSGGSRANLPAGLSYMG